MRIADSGGMAKKTSWVKFGAFLLNLDEVSDIDLYPTADNKVRVFLRNGRSKDFTGAASDYVLKHFAAADLGGKKKPEGKRD